jgi:hypothetical protein
MRLKILSSGLRQLSSSMSWQGMSAVKRVLKLLMTMTIRNPGVVEIQPGVV